MAAPHDHIVAKKRARVIFWQTFALSLFVIWMIVGTTLDVITSWESHSSREHIISCVDPDGNCAQNNKKATQDALELIFEEGIARETKTRQIIILAATCQQLPGVDTLREVEVCVRERLQRQEERDNG